MAKTKKPQEQTPTTVIFVRHGENKWTKKHKLAGRAPGVHLNKTGRKQAKAVGKRLAAVKLAAVYASPLERTIETAEAIASRQNLPVTPCPGLMEVDIGDWTGRRIKDLVKEPAWPVIQGYPTGAAFPGGETMFAMQARMVAQVNDLVAQHPGETIAVVGHADLIKAAVAHYLGVHFDLFQRLVISTASISVVSFTPHGPRVLVVNDTSHNPRPKNSGKKDHKKRN